MRGGECFEQPRTIVIKIRPFISNISKFCWRYLSWATKKNNKKNPITFPCQGNIRGVFHQGICLDNDHCYIVRRTHSFGQGITGAKPIESSEPKSQCYPWLWIDANQIKWFKIHFFLLDFDWCPIEVTIALHFNWTSIGSLGWIALSPHSSLMKCKAFHLRKGWVETHFPRDLNSESFIWPTELHILFHYGAMNILVALFGVPF